MKTWPKLRSLSRFRKLDAEMAEEMRLHLELQTELNVSAGMNEEEARYAARRKFGGVEQIKEQCREQRGWLWLEQVFVDVCYAVRSLRKTPGFTIIAVLSLALGIGANTAVFSVINNRLLETVPLKNPDELVRFQSMSSPLGEVPRLYDRAMGDDLDAESGLSVRLHFSRRIFESFKADHEVLAEVCAVAGLWASTVRVGNGSEVVVSGQLVSGNYYKTLGVSAIRGRTISPEDDEVGAPPVCVISDHYWQKRFSRDPAAIGTTLQVNRVSATIIGVTAPDFHGTMQVNQETDITLPLALGPRVRRDGEMVTKPDYWWLRLIGRMQPGVSREQARARLEPVFQRSAREDLDKEDPRALPRLLAVAADRTTTLRTRQSEFRLFMPMLAMTSLLLLAGCANIANLLLARGVTRRREIAIRLALGATRGRIIRQLLIESVAVALLGAVAGLLISRWNLGLIASLLPDASSGYDSFLQSSQLAVDWRILSFTTLLGLITGVVFGLVPALRATRLNLTEGFQGGSRNPGGNGLGRFSQALVVVQVAVSVVLLICAGLFVRTVSKGDAIDLGFQREQRLLFLVPAQSSGYTGDEATRLYERIAEQIRSVPGVRDVSYSGWPVLTGEGGPYRAKITLPGSSGTEGNVQWNQVGGSFFDVYGMPILRGRSFDSRDQAKTTGVAIVNEAFVKKYLAGSDAVGSSLRLDIDREIVGLVRDARLTRQEMIGDAAPTVFVPFAQSSQGFARFVVWTAGEPKTLLASIRQAVGKVDPNVPLTGISTQAEHVKWRLVYQRLFARLAGYIGLLALGLVSAGLYGLMEYVVSRRTSEIGLRMAVGALPRSLIWMVLRDSFFVVAIGLIVGLGAAAAAMRLLGSMLHGLSPNDPLTFGVVTAFLTGVALLACWLPARRAAKVDPMVALRCE